MHEISKTEAVFYHIEKSTIQCHFLVTNINYKQNINCKLIDTNAFASKIH